MIETAHGEVTTPFFMPDATRASIKGLTHEDIAQTGADALVVNTYHLMLRPGMETIRAVGGVHKLMNWNGVLVSDSGGYQVYSLIHKNPKLGKITEEGAKFRSVIDGRWHMLTPELSIQIQADLGVDMMVVLDDPRPNDAPRAEITEAVARTVRWAARCRDEYERQRKLRNWTSETAPKLFAVIQGGPYVDLRKQCASELVAIGGFDGYGFGGRHLDDNGNINTEILCTVVEAIPADKLKFALGIGTPSDIMICAKMGWQIFDCVIPTREGRHGRVFVWDDCTDGENADCDNLGYHTVNITNEAFTHDTRPIDDNCNCGCTRYSRAYIRHLFTVGDSLAGTITSRHNLRFYMQLMEKLRKLQ